MLFAILAVALVIFVSAFIWFLLAIRKMGLDTFRALCEKKVTRFSKRHKLLSVSNLNILNFQRESLGVHHVVFGKKYIYLISDVLLKGFVSGDVKDNSWLYYDKGIKKTRYIKNLNVLSSKNIQDFAEILEISADPIVSIYVVPNECDFKIKNVENEKKVIVHFSGLNRKIKSFEKKEIGSLNEEQIYEQFRRIKEKNEERNK